MDGILGISMLGALTIKVGRADIESHLSISILFFSVKKYFHSEEIIKNEKRNYPLI